MTEETSGTHQFEQSMLAARARQPAIGNDWQVFTGRPLFGTSSQLRKHYSACHTWQRHNWITSRAVCAAGATFSGNHGREQIISARLSFFGAVSGHRECFSHHAELRRGHTNMNWHQQRSHHGASCWLFENTIITRTVAQLLCISVGAVVSKDIQSLYDYPAQTQHYDAYVSPKLHYTTGIWSFKESRVELFSRGIVDLLPYLQFLKDMVTQTRLRISRR